MVHALRSLGLEAGDTVAAVLPNGRYPVTVYLAALQIGLYYVPINYRLSPPEIAYILSDSDAKAFITHERFADVVVAAADEAGMPAEARFAVGDGPRVRLDFDDFVAGQPDSRADGPHRRCGDALHERHDGSTQGREASAHRTRRRHVGRALHRCSCCCSASSRATGNVHLCTSPNYHTAVTTFAGNALKSGHTVVFMDKWDPEQTLAKIERYRCTHTHMVPTQFNRMLQLPDDVQREVRRVVDEVGRSTPRRRARST